MFRIAIAGFRQAENGFAYRFARTLAVSIGGGFFHCVPRTVEGYIQLLERSRVKPGGVPIAHLKYPTMPRWIYGPDNVACSRPFETMYTENDCAAQPYACGEPV